MEAPESFIGKPVTDLPTPAFLVDRRKVELNCAKISNKCKELGIKLRAQTKTHKTIEGAIMQTGGSKRGLVVSTLQEAWFYAQHGFDDIVYGFPLSPHHMQVCYRLADKLQSFHVIVNSEEGVRLLLENDPPRGKKWSALAKIDCGYPRAGISWTETDRIVSLARSMSGNENVTFQGLYCHCGNSYSTDTTHVTSSRDSSVTRLLSVRDALLEAGLRCTQVGIGSTPSCSLAVQAQMAQLTEIHPGNYIFYDAQQESYGSCSKSEIAVRVMTRVVSHHQDRNQLLVDLGFTGLTRQGLDLLSTPGYGAVIAPNLKLVSMTQELGKVETIDGSKMDFVKYPIGTPLYLHPYHACATAGMYPHYYVHDINGVVTEIWKPTRGW